MSQLTGRCRQALLLISIAFTILCRYMPDMAEWYARTVYPPLSAALSAFSSLFPFPLEEILVIGLVFWLILYPIWKRSKGILCRKILIRIAEVLAGVYVWFYLGWGLNYFRYNIYTRLQTPPVAYEEQHFKDFLKDYTERLNATYQPHTEIDADTLKKHISNFYTHLPAMYGLTKPKAWQEPKEFIFTPLYSKVGVLGSMGPFFAEAQLNADLPEVQYPFTYAHEFSHLLGVSNEAEANYWAYRACTESDITALQYCGHFGLLPYVISNASHLLPKEDYQAWLQTIRPEVKEQFNAKNRYWKERYSPLVGQAQDFVYNLFLKGNQIPSGKKNYAEVIGLLLSLGGDGKEHLERNDFILEKQKSELRNLDAVRRYKEYQVKVAEQEVQEAENITQALRNEALQKEKQSEMLDKAISDKRSKLNKEKGSQLLGAVADWATGKSKALKGDIEDLKLHLAEAHEAIAKNANGHRLRPPNLKPTRNQ